MATTDFGHRCEGRTYEGAPDYYNPRKRGTVIIDDDNRRYVYRVAGDERAAFKRWAEGAFAGMSGKRLTGRWPLYTARGA